MDDVTIIGAGPNGLAAGIQLARKGCAVHIFEAADTIGGGTRTKELTLPGFRHDVCSAIHPMAAASPFLNTLPLEDYGLEWIHPDYPLAHPFDDRSAAVLHRSFEQTQQNLAEDGAAYKKLLQPFVKNWDKLAPQLLGPLPLLPKTPLLLARFGIKALQSVERLASSTFSGERAKALFGGLAAHSMLPLDELSTSAMALVFCSVAHHVGWPFPKGGSEAITQAMADYFESLGGSITCSTKISSTNDLPDSKAIIFDTTPTQIRNICRDKLPDSYVKKLQKFNYGAGVFKVDLALNAPIPWDDPACAKAGTVHLGDTMQELIASEACMKNNTHPEKPFVLVAQQSLFDESRAPEGKHTGWAYCHVPNGSTRDMTQPILNQIERFAPGFQDCIIGQHTMNTRAIETYNANYIGGDINGGRQDITQLFTRPAGLLDPYHMPKSNMFICSASTPPGGGVHGMCGYHAAESVLKYL